MTRYLRVSFISSKTAVGSRVAASSMSRDEDCPLRTPGWGSLSSGSLKRARHTESPKAQGPRPRARHRRLGCSVRVIASREQGGRESSNLEVMEAGAANLEA